MIGLARITAILFLAIVALSLAASGSEQESIAALRVRADSAPPAECAHICIEVARKLIHETGQQYSKGETEAAHKTMADAIHYAELGTRASVQTHRHLKNNEISIRQFARRLSDIGRTLSYDDRTAVDEQIVKLEKLRDLLLDAMFGTPKKSMERKP